jgi:uncharacterized membrane protein
MGVLRTISYIRKRCQEIEKIVKPTRNTVEERNRVVEKLAHTLRMLLQNNLIYDYGIVSDDSDPPDPDKIRIHLAIKPKEDREFVHITHVFKTSDPQGIKEREGVEIVSLLEELEQLHQERRKNQTNV